jgi:hypothetical protein
MDITVGQADNLIDTFNDFTDALEAYVNGAGHLLLR